MIITLALLLERELALLVVVLVLSSSPVFTSLHTACVSLRRCCNSAEIPPSQPTFPLFFGILVAQSRVVGLIVRLPRLEYYVVGEV